MDDSPHAGRFRGGKIVVLISAAIHKHQCHETATRSKHDNYMSVRVLRWGVSLQMKQSRRPSAVK